MCFLLCSNFLSVLVKRSLVCPLPPNQGFFVSNFLELKQSFAFKLTAFIYEPTLFSNEWLHFIMASHIKYQKWHLYIFQCDYRLPKHEHMVYVPRTHLLLVTFFSETKKYCVDLY